MSTQVGAESGRTAKGNPVAYLQRLDEYMHDDVLHTIAGWDFAWQLEVPDNACAQVAVTSVAKPCRRMQRVYITKATHI